MQRKEKSVCEGMTTIFIFSYLFDTSYAAINPTRRSLDHESREVSEKREMTRWVGTDRVTPVFENPCCVRRNRDSQKGHWLLCRGQMLPNLRHYRLLWQWHACCRHGRLYLGRQPFAQVEGNHVEDHRVERFVMLVGVGLGGDADICIAA